MDQNQTPTECKVGILGGGAWGTALGIHCARMGHETLLWAREQEVVDSINGAERENQLFLSGFKIPNGMEATHQLTSVIEFSSILLMVIPTPFVEATLNFIFSLARYSSHFEESDKILVSCTKGILNNSLETVHEILHRILPESFHSRLAFLSGPSFAKEVANKKPTVVTVASTSADVARRVQHTLSTSRFRCYWTHDIIGVELGGALKNVLAIACGISDGLHCGHNGRAALITRGLHEITKIAVGKGANPLTMGGLAGMGDLVLTCTGDLSRNRNVGLRIGNGEKLQDIQNSTRTVAEGVLTSKAAFDLSRKLNIECPIIEGIYKVLHQGVDPVKVLDDVMTRELKEEVDPSIKDAAAGN